MVEKSTEVKTRTTQSKESARKQQITLELQKKEKKEKKRKEKIMVNIKDNKGKLAVDFDIYL